MQPVDSPAVSGKSKSIAEYARQPGAAALLAHGQTGSASPR